MILYLMSSPKRSFVVAIDPFVCFINSVRLISSFFDSVMIISIAWLFSSILIIGTLENRFLLYLDLLIYLLLSDFQNTVIFKYPNLHVLLSVRDTDRRKKHGRNTRAVQRLTRHRRDRASRGS